MHCQEECCLKVIMVLLLLPWLEVNNVGRLWNAHVLKTWQFFNRVISGWVTGAVNASFRDVILVWCFHLGYNQQIVSAICTPKSFFYHMLWCWNTGVLIFDLYKISSAQLSFSRSRSYQGECVTKEKVLPRRVVLPMEILKNRLASGCHRSCPAEWRRTLKLNQKCVLMYLWI